MSWSSGCLFKRTPSGKTRFWRVFTDGEKLYTATGDFGSHETVSAPTVYQAKSVGRSNERPADLAAIDAAKSKYKDKLDSGYVDSVRKLSEQEAIPKAMLARPKLDKELERVEKMIRLGRCYVQPKLDGFRCLADRRGLWTRNLRPIETCNHVWRSIKPLFDVYPDLVIDGELYSDELKGDFSKLQSLLTKQQVDMIEALEVERVIRYHVYDFVDDKPFHSRLIQGRRIVKQFTPSFVLFVKTLKVDSLGFIYKKHASFVKNGYEGTMVRLSRSGYEQDKRSAQLIKLKDFHDEEFRIVSVKEGNGQWAGCAKSVVCFDDRLGVEFDAGCRGSMPHLKHLLEHASDYVGGKVTCQFFDRFPSGKPRFPVATKFFTR